MIRQYIFIDRSLYTEKDEWFALQNLYQREVKSNIEKLHQVAKKMRKDRISLTKATISFKYFINNMNIEKSTQTNPETNRELLDGISIFQTQMARYYQKQTDSDNLLVWFTEDYLDHLKVADTALAVRRGLLMEMDKNMEKTEFQENVSNVRE